MSDNLLLDLRMANNACGTSDGISLYQRAEGCIRRQDKTIEQQAERIRKLEEERDMWKATDIRDAARIDELASQNNKLKDICAVYLPPNITINLPDIATPIINEVRAKTLEEAADSLEDRDDIAPLCCTELRRMAQEKLKEKP